MKEFISKTTITYTWFRGDSDDMDSNHLEQLTDEAEHQIKRYQSDGYTSGELICEIDDIDYRGWFELTSMTESGSEK